MHEVLVTGAGGFVGKALCRRLSNEGRRVRALTRTDGDVTDPAFWSRLPPARVMAHLASRSYVPESWNSPAEFIAQNVIGTQLALDWCRRHGARMVFASAYVYGIPQRLPIHETDAVNPNNPYALSKFLAEQCAAFASRFSGTNATVLRIFNVYGAGQRDEFLLPTLVKQLRGPEIRVMDLAPRRDYVYIDDVVDAVVRALDAPAGFHCINIGSGQSHSVAEVISALQAVAGTSLAVVSSAIYRPQEIPDVRADISRAQDVLGWKPVYDLAAGLFHTLEESNHV